MHENPDNPDSGPSHAMTPPELETLPTEEVLARPPFPGTEAHDDAGLAPADDPSESEAAPRSPRFRFVAMQWLTWDVRFKLAVLLSFLLLVATLVMNRHHFLQGKSDGKKSSREITTAPDFRRFAPRTLQAETVPTQGPAGNRFPNNHETARRASARRLAATSSGSSSGREGRTCLPTTSRPRSKGNRLI